MSTGMFTSLKQLEKKKPKAKPKAPSKTLINAKALKKAGFIDYDLRKPLTKSQASQVSKLAGKYAPILKDPTGFFRLSADTKGISAQARESGFITHAKAIFVPKDGYTKAKIIDDRIILQRKDGWKQIKGGRGKVAVKKREDIILRKRKDILQELERLSSTSLPDNHYLMVRIGSNRAFPRGIRKRLDYEGLMNYISAWEPDALKEYRAGAYKGKYSKAELVAQKHDLISQMSIVSYRF